MDRGGLWQCGVERVCCCVSDVMWVPSMRCTPEQFMQMNRPRLNDAQVGLGMLQSAHTLLPGFFTITASILIS